MHIITNKQKEVERMEIDKNVTLYNCLLFKSDSVSKTGYDQLLIIECDEIIVKTDGTEFDEEYIGEFEFIDNENIGIVDGCGKTTIIPLEYIIEIEKYEE